MGSSVLAYNYHYVATTPLHLKGVRSGSILNTRGVSKNEFAKTRGQLLALIIWTYAQPYVVTSSYLKLLVWEVGPKMPFPDFSFRRVTL